MIDTDADEAVVGGEVVNAVRDRLADCIGRKVVDVHQVRLAFGVPLASTVLEVAAFFSISRSISRRLTRLRNSLSSSRSAVVSTLGGLFPAPPPRPGSDGRSWSGIDGPRVARYITYQLSNEMVIQA